MHPTETIQQFYARARKTDVHGFSLNNAGLGHFNVFTRDACNRVTPYGRRDYYKISLILGTGRLHYTDRSISLDRPSLVFFNPVVPYSWEAVSEEQKGWCCVFTETFVHPAEPREALHDTHLFRTAGMPVFFINRQQQQALSRIYREMMREMESDYIHKFDLLRNYLHLLIHQAMKMQPGTQAPPAASAAARITQQFLDLLERQFPIDADTELRLKTANDFADKLAVHVNHLNRALKEVTGKTTTELISARIIQEAIALLRHSDWNIAQIAYGLGFEYPTYFNIFFKKHTGKTPMEARHTPV